jgi:hypothetical protein
MTQKEHDLIVMMFTAQSVRIRALTNILETKGVASKEDLQNQEMAVFQEMGPTLHEFSKSEYQRYAQKLGMLETCSSPIGDPPKKTN